MSKKTMWILLIVGLAFIVVGSVAYAITFIPLSTSFSTFSDPTSTPQQVNEALNKMLTGLSIALPLLLVGSLIELVGRIGMLVRQGTLQQWPWFICTLLFGWVCMLVYLIVWPETPQSVVSAPAYMPQYQSMQQYQPMPQYQSMQQYQSDNSVQPQGMEQNLPQE